MRDYDARVCPCCRAQNPFGSDLSQIDWWFACRDRRGYRRRLEAVRNDLRRSSLSTHGTERVLRMHLEDYNEGLPFRRFDAVVMPESSSSSSAAPPPRRRRLPASFNRAEPEALKYKYFISAL